MFLHTRFDLFARWLIPYLSIEFSGSDYRYGGLYF